MLEFLRKIADNSFMPLSIVTGVCSIKTIKGMLSIDAEEVVINIYALENSFFINDVAETFSSSKIIVIPDAKEATWERLHRHVGMRYKIFPSICEGSCSNNGKYDGWRDNN